MLNKNPIIKGTIILTIASLLSRIIGFLYRIFLSNLIGAKGMGVFQLIFPVLVFCIALSGKWNSERDVFQQLSTTFVFYNK